MKRFQPVSLAPAEAESSIRHILPILIVLCCVSSGVGMVWSVLAIYVDSLGISMSLVGIMMGAFAGARLFVNLPASLLAMRFGRRRMMLAGLALLAASSLAAFYAASPLPLFLCLLLQGTGSASFATAALIAIADRGRLDTRVRDMAGFQGAHLIGLTIGPAVGGILAAHLGYPMTFTAQGLMAVIALALLHAIGPDPARRDVAARPASSPVSEANGGTVAVRIAALAALSYAHSYVRIGVNWVLLPLVCAKWVGMDIGQVGVALMVGAIINLAILPGTARLALRLGRLRLITVASVIVVLGVGVLSQCTSVAEAWLAASLLGIGSGLAVPTLTAHVADITPPARTGAALGLMRTMLDLGMCSAPVTIGFLTDLPRFGIGGVLLLCAVLLAAANAAMLVALRRPDRRAPARGLDQ
ncbi:MAG: MFS transporter [Alphaproteobacteria bacterium]|nr:MFS transporter [Alphaproteobacteria bacterium]